MLPTLNLQLSSVELLDNTYATPGSPLPGAGGEVESGFGDLLRLRVDASTLPDESGGELLPQSGSGLPILADLEPTQLATEILPAPKIDPGLIKLSPGQGMEGSMAELTDLPDLVLETPVLYPQLDAAAAAKSLTASSAIPGVVAVPLLATSAIANPARTESTAPGALDSSIRLDVGPNATAGPTLTSLAITAREASPLASTDDVVLTPAASIGLRERGQLGEPQARTAPIALTSPVAESPERMALADATRRPDFMGLQRVDGLSETSFESVQPRVAAPQPGQTLHAQLNTQISQAPLTTAAASLDVTYAGLTQQTTDLIGTSVRDSAWGNQLGERVVMMAGSQLRTAEIRLTPAELGPLRVQVSVDDGATNVTFHAQHAVTREAIEQALPRLREMLAENGLSLGQADVSDRGVGEGNGHDGTDRQVSGHPSEDSQDAGGDADLQTARRVTTGTGLVDTFA